MDVISAAINNTKHEDSVNVKYVYDKIRTVKAEIV